MLLLQRLLKLLDALVLLSQLLLLLPRGSPNVRFAREADLHEEVAQLDTRAERAPHLQYSIPSSKPPKHRSLVGEGMLAFVHANAKKRGVRLCSDTVNSAVDGGVQTVA
eukprot:CAMPEP_0195571128 /NCGR_PEP_ID=MMETSP0814-20130614/3906_1 /TAXON_ID=97485 /ORGANISM="Prymnesium parvum, Strain Texoma1" /LENGTH=108 /DNA_ID=CAMNT_0040706715 /DNA_START=386 /DNA_END=708 /DNA_ORIENTATION=-